METRGAGNDSYAGDQVDKVLTRMYSVLLQFVP